MMLCGSLRDRIQPWLRDYVKLQSLAVFLIYIQVSPLPLSLSSNRESRVHRFVIVFFPDWLRPNWITRSIIQRRLTDQLSDCVVRACCNRKQQPKPRPHLRPSPLLRSSPRYLLVHPLHPRDLVIPSFESILTNL